MEGECVQGDTGRVVVPGCCMGIQQDSDGCYCVACIQGEPVPDTQVCGQGSDWCHWVRTCVIE